MEKNNTNNHINNNKFKRQSPAKWSSEFNLNVLDYSKCFTPEEYENSLVKREEYLNKISLCSIQKPEIKSRRDAVIFLQKLNQPK